MEKMALFFDVLEDNNIKFKFNDQILVPSHNIDVGEKNIYIELKPYEEKEPIGELIQYIREKKKAKNYNQKTPPRGVMYSTLDKNGNIAIGYSLCNKKVDKFDSEIGLNLAKKRAKQLSRAKGKKEFEIPPSIESDIIKFLERSLRYFKEARTKITITKIKIKNDT